MNINTIRRSDKPERWWVVFCSRLDPDGPRQWWHLFTRPGFEHCFAFCEWVDEICLVVHPRLQDVEFELLRTHAFELIAQVKRDIPDPTIIVYEPKSDPYNPARRGIGITCATLTGYMLGIDSTALTPYGLHRNLIEAGGKTIWGT